MIAKNECPEVQNDHVPGDVFQINENFPHKGWVGAFVLATEVKPWGIQGFVAHIETHESQRSAYIRLHWDQVEYIGKAVLVPGEEGEDP